MSASKTGGARLTAMLRAMTVTRLLAAAVVVASIALGFAHRPSPLTIGDYLYYLFLAANGAFAVALLVREGSEALPSERSFSYLLFRPPEILLALGVVLFLFTFIYATNANMSYVQRFMATHGNIHLAPDSRRERLAACIQYLPMLALDAFWYVFYRLRYPRSAAEHPGIRQACGYVGPGSGHPFRGSVCVCIPVIPADSRPPVSLLHRPDPAAAIRRGVQPGVGRVLRHVLRRHPDDGQQLLAGHVRPSEPPVRHRRDAPGIRSFPGGIPPGPAVEPGPWLPGIPGGVDRVRLAPFAGIPGLPLGNAGRVAVQRAPGDSDRVRYRGSGALPSS